MGKPLKKLVIKVFNRNNQAAKTHQITADNGRIFVDVSPILNRFAEQIEKQWPEDEYRMVELGPGRFNFIWVGPRKPEQEAA
jgi:hypothetical protein